MSVVRLIKHQFDGPFIPLNIVKEVKEFYIKPKYIAKKNIKKYGIRKDQSIVIVFAPFGIISFAQHKKHRYVSLTPKEMKLIRDVK